MHNLKGHCFSPYKTLLQRTHHIQSTVDMILQYVEQVCNDTCSSGVVRCAARSTTLSEMTDFLMYTTAAFLLRNICYNSNNT